MSLKMVGVLICVVVAAVIVEGVILSVTGANTCLECTTTPNGNGTP